jgi:hypothetical protein
MAFPSWLEEVDWSWAYGYPEDDDETHRPQFTEDASTFDEDSDESEG